MKVKQLIKKLQKLNQNLEVVIESDSTLNIFDITIDISTGHYDGVHCLDPEEFADMKGEPVSKYKINACKIF